MADIVTQDIHYRFGRHRVLKGVTMSADDGECVVLYGANGAGKSTLLGVLSTRLRPRQGRYTLNGHDVAEEGQAIRAATVFIGHHTHLYGHLTPVENLRFFMDLRGVPVAEGRLRQVVAEVGLKRFADRPARGFSAGMRKRLALARMMLADPPLLLLDEPYSALDREGVVWLNGVLAEYQAGGGTIIMATHDPERVAALHHRALHMVDGRLHMERPGGENEA